MRQNTGRSEAAELLDQFFGQLRRDAQRVIAGIKAADLRAQGFSGLRRFFMTNLFNAFQRVYPQVTTDALK